MSSRRCACLIITAMHYAGHLAYKTKLKSPRTFMRTFIRALKIRPGIECGQARYYYSTNPMR